MMLGIIVGTYSSIYVSSSLLVVLGLRPENFDRKPDNKVASGAERVTKREEGQV
jgi:preprotein translocase subunit SecF